MGCVQSKELEGNGPFPLQSSPLNASLGKEDISDELGSQDKKSTSSEATDQHLLIHGPVELRNGCSRKKRHLFLLNNSLLISNTRYKKIFKIKYVIPLRTLWMDKVEDSHSSGKKSFLLGWPMENFKATFPSLEQKEKWCSFLERNINLVKEEDQQKSLELQIFTKDIQHSVILRHLVLLHKIVLKEPVAVTAASTDMVNDVIMKTLSILGKSGCEKEYLLSFDSGKEEAPFMLTGFCTFVSAF